MNRSRALLAGTALAAAISVVGVDDPTTAAAVPADRPYCSLTGMTTYEWDGGGDGTSWSDPANWVDDTRPLHADRSLAYVCIPDGATVELAEGDVALVQAIDTTTFSTLDIEPGAGLFVYGDPTLRPSAIRGFVDVGGALGGPGLIVLTETGLMGTGVGSSDEVLPTPAALASNPCALFDDLPVAACTHDDGRFVDYHAMNGYGGVALRGGYDLVLHGALVPGDAGIGMSAGSRLVVGADGQVNIHGDADFYPLSARGRRPVLVNNGILRKFRGGGSPSERGVTAISTAYRGNGEVWVEDQDEVVITDGSRRPAEVTAGSLLGSGPCRRVVGDCRLTTLRRPGQRQSAVLQAPASQPESQRALVEVRPLPHLRRPGDLGAPYYVHADELGATATTPAIIELRFDGTLLGNRTWAEVQIFRQRAAREPWRRIRTCRDNGTPPGGRHACVDRRGLAASSRPVPNSGGDAILVVRTTVTSRWVGH